MPRKSVVAALALLLTAPTIFTGCQNGFGRTAKGSAEANDVYVQRARQMGLSDAAGNSEVAQVAYHQQGLAVGASANDATDPPIGDPATGQYSTSQMASLSKPYSSPFLGSSHRNCSSSAGAG
ncbi:MAG: hypothetical protein WBF93_11245 [Pirellulales bacterium]